ncbi:MAG TPA: hypothetical protein VE866_05480, partial [Candidatus Binatia bacterium]|nr:hypothetical protein [Candidatus Binatia bacterium]
MKFASGIPLAALLGASLLVTIVPAHGRDKDKDKDKKEKPAAAQTVDSGSFGIFVRGQRVATETFSIQQQNGASSIKSQFKE